MKEHLMQQLDLQPQPDARRRGGPGAGGRPPRRSWRPRPLTLAVGAAAFAAAAIVAVGLVPGAPRKDGQPSFPGQIATANALERAAAAAASGPGNAPGPGQFRYQRAANVDLSNVQGKRGALISYQISSETRLWIGADGSAHQRIVPGRTRPLGPANRRAWIAAGRPRLVGVSPLDERAPAGSWRIEFGSTALTAAQLGRLPTDPKALTARIRELALAKVAGELGPQPAPRTGVIDGVDVAMFEIVGILLEESPAPPPLRAALYRALDRFPDVREVGMVNDPAGRRGVAVALVGPDGATTADGSRIELVFDPGTSALLAERTVTVRPNGGVGAGTVLTSKTYMESGLGGSDHATP
jgi:hypothetical protein